ncbi:MAG: FliI/YscN family ATPase [Treponema sp.]|nr:FliI/YscN family ATPase [Treponema sp.]MCL2272130.1 FliI/YscN family ATPase [Treponema sp.]
MLTDTIETAEKTDTFNFNKYLESTERTDPIKYVGKVSKVQGLLVESHGPQAIIGEICRIVAPKGRGNIRAEVVGLKNDTVQLMVFDETEGIEIGDRVIALGSRLEVPVSAKLLGRVLDALGNPIDGKGDISSSCMYPALANPPDPLKRKRVTQRITTGVRAIDGLLAVGKGQRLGIFSGSGVGKSTLLGMIARNTTADVNVIALIGERGREVNDFLENDLGEEGLARSVLIVTPSNSPPLARLRGAYVATAVAEYFRDQGKDVMLLFDSVTRFARAMREIGLASGEPPAQRGFPPSMFDSMPKLLERSGTSDTGSITGFYTVLVDGDDMDEPVADTVRGILDGHIVLSRDLAQSFHYPAIDVLQSVSRLAPSVSGEYSKKAAGFIRRNMASYAKAEDFINVGAYPHGSNPEIDEAIGKHGPIEDFLIQDIDEPSPLEDTLSRMAEITGIEIPPEEMTDNNEKLLAAAGNVKRKEKTAGMKTGFIPPVSSDIGSVASLFSSLPTSSLFDAG